MSEVTMKSTKQQIFDAYQEALKKVEDINALKETPADKVEAKRKEAVMENADIATMRGVFSEDIVKQYEDLQEAISLKKNDLKELYEIEAKASSLAAMINANKEMKLKLDESYQATKTELQEELNKIRADIIAAKEEVQTARKDEIAKVTVERKREAEEYKYNLERERKKENDAWEDEKVTREKELVIKEANAEAMLAEAESKAEEIEELRAKVDQISTLVSEAEERGKKAGQEAAKKAYEYEKTLYEKDKGYEIAKLQDKVEALTQAKEDAETKARQLQEKLDEAYTKMNTLASDTVKANGSVKIVSSSAGQGGK